MNKTIEEQVERELNEIIKGKEFNKDQLYEIRYGLLQCLDVSIYSNPKYNDEQMYEIRKGLEQSLDVSSYLDPNISVEDMFIIRSKLQGINID